MFARGRTGGWNPDARLDHDVVDVGLCIYSDLVVEALLHGSLICGSSVLEPEGHCDVTEWAIGRDEGCLLLI